MSKSWFCEILSLWLVGEIEAGVEIEGDAATILGVGAAKLANNAIFKFKLFAIKIVDYEVKSDDLLLVVDIKTVSLENGGVFGDDFFEAATHCLVGFGLAIFGVDTNGESDTKLCEGALGDFASQTVDVSRGEAVGDLDVDGADIGTRAVIVENEVIGAVDLWKAADKIV